MSGLTLKALGVSRLQFGDLDIIFYDKEARFVVFDGFTIKVDEVKDPFMPKAAFEFPMKIMIHDDVLSVYWVNDKGNVDKTQPFKFPLMTEKESFVLRLNQYIEALCELGCKSVAHVLKAEPLADPKEKIVGALVESFCQAYELDMGLVEHLGIDLHKITEQHAFPE